MNTTPVNTRLDVGARLRQLKAWQQEWQTENDLLNHRLAQLDPDKSVDIQRAEQIVRLQQRLRLKLVRYPLEMDIQAVPQAGYEAVRQQLGAQFALLTRDQRRLWLPNF